MLSNTAGAMAAAPGRHPGTANPTPQVQPTSTMAGLALALDITLPTLSTTQSNQVGHSSPPHGGAKERAVYQSSSWPIRTCIQSAYDCTPGPRSSTKYCAMCISAGEPCKQGWAHCLYYPVQVYDPYLEGEYRESAYPCLQAHRQRRVRRLDSSWRPGGGHRPPARAPGA